MTSTDRSLDQHAPVEAMDEVRALLAEHDGAGELAACPMRSVLLGNGVLEQVPATVAELLGERAEGARVVLLVDRATITRGGVDAKQSTYSHLAKRFATQRVVLDDGHPELHVSEDVVATAREAVTGAQAVVALGGGTISDIGKAATAGLDPAPVLVSVQTAASVDGYTDDVSVVLLGGVKRTVPTRWPDAVLADAAVVAEAPARMNRAGFGEMLSMLTAPADWQLAAYVGTESKFHEAPLRLLDAVGEGLREWAPGVGEGDPAAVERLTRALAVRGVVTGVAGTTATLSGVEHLVSHMLDLHHAEHHLPMGLHGAQVGAASVVAACAWELLDERLAAHPGARLRPELLEEDAARTAVEATFDHLGERVVAECWRDYSVKLAVVRERREHVDALLADWGSVADRLRSLVRPSEELAAGLREARAAATLAELDPAVNDGLARWAVGGCHRMRNRFTVVDLLHLLGWWEPADVEEVLARAAARAGADAAAGSVS